METTAKKLIGLEEVTGLPVEEGDYGGDAAEYIVFDHTGERGEVYGDDTALIITDDIQIRVTLDIERDYYDLQKAIWGYLEAEDFYDINFNSYCQQDSDGMARCLVCDCSYTGLKGE